MHPSIHAKQNPDKPAYIMAARNEVVTYGELNDHSNQAAQLFRSIGLNAGDGIAIFMENQARFFEICWAAQRAGLYYTPISTKLTADEVAYIVNDCGAKALIASMELENVAGALPPLTPAVEKFYAVGGKVEGYESYVSARNEQPAEPIADESAGRDMLYSSGTTGRPKGIKVPLDGGPIDAPIELVGLVTGLYGFDEDTIYLSPAPLYHAAPLRYCMAVQRIGGTCVVMENFNAQDALYQIQKHKVTASQWVPTMFVRLLKLRPDIRFSYDLSSHKAAIHAAAPCPKTVKSQMIQWWGPIIYEYYAGSEGCGFCSITSDEWLAHEGSVGRAMLGETHILDEDGNELPAGQKGSIYFANGPVFEYHNDPERTADAHNDKGWATLGDIGYMDGEGYLYLTDRKANMIISGGVNIYPQETENVLLMHPRVTDVAVIGVPNEEFGEEVKAVVQLEHHFEAGPDMEMDLIDYCRSRLSAIKCPKSVDFERQLPRHPTGKLYKRLVRDRYWGKKDSRIV